VDPVSGSDTNPGTATQPFQTVEYALTTDVVRVAANTIGSGTDGGTDVTVTIVRAATQGVSSNISTPSLTKGSVTVVGPRDFTLQLNGKLLTLNKGYRLKGFQITSGDPDADSNNQNQAAIKLAGVGTSLNNMNIDCRGLGDAGMSFTSLGDRCIEVTATTLGGTITLEGLEVVIKGNQNQNYTAGIVHKGSNTTLRVVGSTIRSTGTDGRGVVGVLGEASAGPVIVQSSTVDLESINSGTDTEPNIAILLNVGGSQVLGPNSEIKLNGGGGNTPPDNPEGAIGIKASHSSGTVTVEGTKFRTGTNGVGIGIKNAATGTGTLSLGTTNTFPSPPPPCGSGTLCLWKNVDPPSP